MFVYLGNVKALHYWWCAYFCLSRSFISTWDWSVPPYTCSGNVCCCMLWFVVRWQKQTLTKFSLRTRVNQSCNWTFIKISSLESYGSLTNLINLFTSKDNYQLKCHRLCEPFWYLKTKIFLMAQCGCWCKKVYKFLEFKTNIIIFRIKFQTSNCSTWQVCL